MAYRSINIDFGTDSTTIANTSGIFYKIYAQRNWFGSNGVFRLNIPA